MFLVSIETEKFYRNWLNLVCIPHLSFDPELLEAIPKSAYAHGSSSTSSSTRWGNPSDRPWRCSRAPRGWPSFPPRGRTPLPLLRAPPRRPQRHTGAPPHRRCRRRPSSWSLRWTTWWTGRVRARSGPWPSGSPAARWRWCTPARPATTSTGSASSSVRRRASPIAWSSPARSPTKWLQPSASQ